MHRDGETVTLLSSQVCATRLLLRVLWAWWCRQLDEYCADTRDLDTCIACVMHSVLNQFHRTCIAPNFELIQLYRRVFVS